MREPSLIRANVAIVAVHAAGRRIARVRLAAAEADGIASPIRRRELDGGSRDLAPRVDPSRGRRALIELICESVLLDAHLPEAA
jgi:hypothetical protein